MLLYQTAERVSLILVWFYLPFSVVWLDAVLYDTEEVFGEAQRQLTQPSKFYNFLCFNSFSKVSSEI